MLVDSVKESFFNYSQKWLCDNYSASIRFIGELDNGTINLWKSAIFLSPLPFKEDNSFSIKSERIYLGQIDINLTTKIECLDILKNAILGNISTPLGDATLPIETRYNFYSETNHRDRFQYDLHLSIKGSPNNSLSSQELAEIDNALRMSNPPFDGLSDAAAWLGLGDAIPGNYQSEIELRISPPADLDFEKCFLKDNAFNLSIRAIPTFDTKLLNVAVRGVPGINLKTRLQVSNLITWEEGDDNLNLGTVSIEIPNSDSAIVILMLGKSIVRRQWFLDSSKTKNSRLLAIQSFDKDLKMIKNAVLDNHDPSKFEYGIAALLFILGFYPCVQIETDSPDLIVQSPNGRMILVECTLRISDFSAKIGKLVDRRGKLIKELEKNGQPSSVLSVLICRLPRDQIAAQSEELNSHKVILIAREQLEDLFNQVRQQKDPDRILDEATSEVFDDNQMSLDLN